MGSRGPPPFLRVREGFRTCFFCLCSAWILFPHNILILIQTIATAGVVLFLLLGSQLWVQPHFWNFGYHTNKCGTLDRQIANMRFQV